MRTERGRLPCVFLRGLGGANLIGEGKREGSFSLLAVEVLFSSFSFSASEDVMISSWSVVGGKDESDVCCCVGCGCEVLPFFFIVTDCTFISFRERSARVSSCCSWMTVPASSPLSFASFTAIFMSAGIGAWIDVMTIAWRAKAS